MTLDEWVQLLDAGGTVALLLLVLFAVYKGWLVPGWVYRECEAREREWHDLALTGSKALDRITARQAAKRGSRRA